LLGQTKRSGLAGINLSSVAPRAFGVGSVLGFGSGLTFGSWFGVGCRVINVSTSRRGDFNNRKNIEIKFVEMEKAQSICKYF